MLNRFQIYKQTKSVKNNDDGKGQGWVNYKQIKIKKMKKVITITMLVSLLMLLSSCNVTRIVTTEASHFQKGDTTTTIVTKTTETYEGTKK